MRKIILYLSDAYYVLIEGDRSSMAKHKKSLGIKHSWRDYARNPMVGIFKKFL